MSVGVGTVGVAVGIDDGAPLVVFVTGALLTAPASAPTDGELAKLPPRCLTGAGGFIEYELEMTLTFVGAFVAVRCVTTLRLVVVVLVTVRVRVLAAAP